MDKLNFAVLMSYIQALISRGGTISRYEAEEIDKMVQPDPNNRTVVDPTVVDALLNAMGMEDQKIEAIKQYRTLTGLGLKESKDAVERYWRL